MRPTRLLTGAALSAAALGLSTAAAYAGDFGAIEVSPGTAKAGSTVSLSTKDCGSSQSANVDAGTLGAGSVKLAAGANKGTLTGQMKIKSGVKDGNYGVGGKCGNGKEITGTVHVGMQGGASSSPSSQGGTGHSASPSMPAKEKTGPSMPAKEMPTASMSAKPGSTMPPKGKMKTGEGSTSENSGNTTEIAAGAGVLLAAAAGGIWVVRRRRMGGGRY
ncbi:hypothetical protein [Streptomyces sp. GS7]|uniref:hypothetical protein n=1 Tax=Streptomyces sp. GS7 TaxID=2692234 RepID=UPI0013192917|nr:hypothetical protein [Streptomyces sp. GS7]QHC21794.1 hypothetical protein GR130_10505 [Streptomyces sp. GS7]